MAGWIGRRLTAVALMVVAVSGAPATGQEPEIGHLRLVDRLDRPVDGYCLDILGVGSRLRVDLPVFAHNCKPGLTPDSAVAITEAGEIVFAALDLCVTVFGVNRGSLPGSPILLRECAGAASFFDAGRFQRFTFEENGQVRLEGSDLCLAVGEEADSTFSAADRWRALTVETCAETPAALSAWEFNTGPFPSP